MGLIALVILNLPVYFMTGYLFFGNWEGFKESLYYVLRPDLLSLFDGEYWDDHWHTLKFGIWLACCIGIVAAEMHKCPKLVAYLSSIL